MNDNYLEQRIAQLESQLAELRNAMQPIESVGFNIIQGYNGFAIQHLPKLNAFYNNYDGQFSVIYYYDEASSTTMALVCNGEQVNPLERDAGWVALNGSGRYKVQPALFPLVKGYIFLHVFRGEGRTLEAELIWVANDNDVESDISNEYIELAQIAEQIGNYSLVIMQSWRGGSVNIVNRWL